jgi:hypothetical protein
MSKTTDQEKGRQHEFIEDLRLALIKGTHGCELQEGANGKSWPCGTCTCALLGSVLPETAPQYAEHNDPVDRINEVWRAILQIRDLPS